MEKKSVKEVSFSNVYEDTVPVLDHENQTIVNIPKSDLDIALRTGKYTLPKGTQVPVVDEDGQGGYLPAEEVYGALNSGLRVENPEDTKTRELEEQYGDRDITAGLLGGARGLSFGLSDTALAKTGLVKPETLRGIEEANPVSSTAGEIGGVAAGLLIPGAQVGVGVKAAAKAGQIAERQVLKSLAKLNIEKGVAKSIAGKIAPAIAGGAVEGALYGTGQLISEDALGKADFNAENLIGNMGMGAIFGGALSGTLGALALGGKLVKSGSSTVGKSIKGFTSELTDEVKAAQELTGMSAREIVIMNKNRPNVAKELPGYLKNDLKIKITDTTEDIAKKVDDKLEAAGNSISSIEKKLADAGEKFDKVLPSGSEVFEKITNRVGKEVIEKIDDAVAGPAPKSQILNMLERFSTEMLPKTKYTTSEMYQKMRALDDELRVFYKNPEGRPELQQAMFQIRRVFREEIDNAAERMAEKVGVNPAIAKELKQANRDFFFSSQIANTLDKKMAVKSGTGIDKYLLLDLTTRSPESAIAGFSAKFIGSDLRRKAVILSNIEKANIKINKNIAEGVKTFFETTSRPALQVLRYEATKSYLARDEKGKAPKSNSDAYNNIISNVNRSVNNPELYLEQINKKTAGLYEVAPETSSALDMQALRGAQFLASKAPPQPEKQGVFDILNPRQPSDAEISKFMRYVETVEKPETAIQSFREGTLTQEQAETLRNVYPNIYGRLFEQVNNYITTHKKTLPYNKKLQLGIIMDMPTDKSMMPENILALQKIVKGGNQNQTINPTQGGLDKLNVSDRMNLDRKED